VTEDDKGDTFKIPNNISQTAHKSALSCLKIFFIQQILPFVFLYGYEINALALPRRTSGVRVTDCSQEPENCLWLSETAVQAFPEIPPPPMPLSVNLRSS
jgi:hypothetical protein